MPLRIQTSSCAQNLSKRRLASSSAAELVALAGLVRREIAGIRAQHAAIELRDARRHAIEERAVVRDHDAGGHLQQQLFEPLDAVDVEMVRRLVEQQQLRLQRERECQRRAFALATGAVARVALGVEVKAMQKLLQPRFHSPLLAIVWVRPIGEQAVAQGRRGCELWLLLHE